MFIYLENWFFCLTPPPKACQWFFHSLAFMNCLWFSFKHTIAYDVSSSSSLSNMANGNNNNSVVMKKKVGGLAKGYLTNELNALNYTYQCVCIYSIIKLTNKHDDDDACSALCVWKSMVVWVDLLSLSLLLLYIEIVLFFFSTLAHLHSFSDHFRRAHVHTEFFFYVAEEEKESTATRGEKERERWWKKGWRGWKSEKLNSDVNIEYKNEWN